MKSKEILLILFSRPFLVKFSACLFVVVNESTIDLSLKSIFSPPLPPSHHMVLSLKVTLAALEPLEKFQSPKVFQSAD